MIPDPFTQLLTQLAQVEHLFHGLVDVWFLIFARLLGFIIVAPVFGRKDIPFNIKMGFAMILATILLWTVGDEPLPAKAAASDNLLWYLIQVGMNLTIGYMIGLIGAMIMEVINSAGSLMNNQIGLSSAMMFDPSTRQQVALVEKLTGFIGLMIFLQLGGMYWLISALNRSFEIFPFYMVNIDITQEIKLDYIIDISGHCLSIGLQLMAPVMVVTMAVDLMLGIVNRTAQQIQVFQLSHALKPSIGIAAFLVSLPLFIKLIETYLLDNARIF